MIPSSETYSRSPQAVVDLGTSKIVCAIGRFDTSGKKLEILSASQTACAELPKGFIHEDDALENAILKVVSQAEQTFGESVKSVYVNISNTEVLSEWVRMQQNVEGHLVDENHLNALLDVEATLSPERDFDVIFSQELSLSLDGHKNIHSPLGMEGKVLKGILHVVTAKRAFLKRLKLVFKRCHLGIDGVFHTGFASGLGTTSKDERIQGVTVVDVGAELTTVALFHQGLCVFNDVIPIGGRHITHDIAAAFQIPVPLAERLKNLYGGLIISPADRQETITLNTAKDGASKTIQKSELMEVIYYRVQEIFFLVKQKVMAQNLENTAGRRYVLTGGSCQLPGMRELGNRLLERPLRLGRPLNVVGTASFIEGPAFATSAGLLYAALLKPKGHRAGKKSLVKRVSSWIKDNL